ncbi:MAG: (deoxy)nucleoside triphosphate pyrophosphohydrolase [Mycobacteriales bacterium]
MSPPVVVAAALVRDTPGGKQVLAARRAHPPELAGWWEFPGGKVEPGETEVAALARECREELGIEIEVGGRVGPDLEAGAILRVYLARATRGRLRPIEHSELRWLTIDRLNDVAWLPADASVVAELRRLFGSHR